MSEQTQHDLLEEGIVKTLEDLQIEQFTSEDQATTTALLEKLKVLHTQQIELQKFETETAFKSKELELEALKLENERLMKARELDLKEQNDKRTAELKEAEVREQKKANVTNAVLGGVTAATGVAGILATLHCFKKSMIFEETGSYTNKSGQMIGSLTNLFRRR